VYIADLLRHNNNSGIGCNAGGKLINILAYAGDLVKLVSTCAGLQSLILFLSPQLAELLEGGNLTTVRCLIFVFFQLFDLSN